eukprot:TRINITY_DN21832_c0_g1_i1.p1 TRINITY_DN21832_c0_g1~~TRINITY_DN21832_c0_g1_i1.p1  ORF type:complete len:249 (+),score=24.97 TRINITY_DN21832_c0_g1_i1:149-895(+)
MPRFDHCDSRSPPRRGGGRRSPSRGRRERQRDSGRERSASRRRSPPPRSYSRRSPSRRMNSRPRSRAKGPPAQETRGWSRDRDRRRGDDCQGDRRPPSPRQRSPSRSRRMRSGSRSRSRSRGGGRSPPPRQHRSPSRGASPRPQSPSKLRPGDAEFRRGAVQIGGPGETPDPTIEVEEATKRANGDSTWQALLNIVGYGGRVRTFRGPPRPQADGAQIDGEEMKKAFLTGGVAKLRETQQKQRKSSVG